MEKQPFQRPIHLRQRERKVLEKQSRQIYSAIKSLDRNNPVYNEAAHRMFALFLLSLASSGNPNIQIFPIT